MTRRLSRITTRLYDKLEQRTRRCMQLSRCVPASSNVNGAAKPDTFVSHFQRLRFIICMFVVVEVARVKPALLAARDYPLHCLLRASDEPCALHPSATWLH